MLDKKNIRLDKKKFSITGGMSLKNYLLDTFDKLPFDWDSNSKAHGLKYSSLGNLPRLAHMSVLLIYHI